MCRETFHSHQDPLKCPSLPLVLLLLLRDPVLYLEHVGRDRLQPGGDGELRLDGDVDHGVVPAGLPEGQVPVGVPGVDVPGEGREELGHVVGDRGGRQVGQRQVGLLVMDLRGDADVNISPQ